MVRDQRFHIVRKMQERFAVEPDAFDVLQELCLFHKVFDCAVASGFVCRAHAHHAELCRAVRKQLFLGGAQLFNIINIADKT